MSILWLSTVGEACWRLTAHSDELSVSVLYIYRNLGFANSGRDWAADPTDTWRFCLAVLLHVFCFLLLEGRVQNP